MSEGLSDLEEVRSLAQALEESLPASFEIAMLTLESKIPFKLLSYREALIHRFADTCVAAVGAVEANRPVSAALLTRGSMETLARMKELKDQIERFLQSQDTESLDSFVMNRLFGSRNNPDLPNAVSVLTSLDKMSDLIPNFRNVYDSLSEYCHPNYQGVSGSFSKIDHEYFTVIFGDSERKERAMQTILPALTAGCHLFTYVYNAVGDLMYAVNNHFESASL